MAFFVCFLKMGEITACLCTAAADLTEKDKLIMQRRGKNY